MHSERLAGRSAPPTSPDRPRTRVRAGYACRDHRAAAYREVHLNSRQSTASVSAIEVAESKLSPVLAPQRATSIDSRQANRSTDQGHLSFYTAREVAAILKISTDSVIRKFSSLPGVIDLGSPEQGKKRQYRVLRIPREALERFILENRVA